MKQSQRVVVVEDDRKYREGITTVLELTPNFSLVSVFGSVEEVLAAAEESDSRGRGVDQWDIVLMDINLPGAGGVEGTAALKALRDDLCVVMLTTFEQPDTILRAICAGADGYLLKRTPLPEFLALLQQVSEGASPLSPQVAHALLKLVRSGQLPNVSTPTAPGPDLTEREVDVLTCLVDGLTYKGAAARLFISVDTVRSHIKNLYRKLQVNSVSEAVSRALREGLV